MKYFKKTKEQAKEKYLMYLAVLSLSSKTWSLFSAALVKQNELFLYFLLQHCWSSDRQIGELFLKKKSLKILSKFYPKSTKIVSSSIGVQKVFKTTAIGCCYSKLISKLNLAAKKFQLR